MTDPSSTLAANLDALGLAHLAERVTLGPHDGWRVEWTTPFPALSMEGEGGNWVALGSRRAPLEEARAQVAEARGDQPWPSLVVLLGAGLGYAIDVVEAGAPAGTRVLVIEPFAASAAALLARRDWRGLIESGRLTVLIGPQFAGSGELWRQIEPRQPPPLIVTQTVVARLRPDATAAAQRVLDRAMFDASANAEARETLGGRYLVNTLRNLPRILDAPDLRTMTDARKGQPVVVCGAGPSLNANLRDLRSFRDHVTLVAVDTSLRPILESGLEPDLVVALDASALNARHLNGLAQSGRTWLVSEAALDPAAFDSFGERIVFFRVGDNDPWPWLAGQGVDVPVLAAWGSVLTSAFALAEWLGADPVVMMGADLAFTGGQPYCRGTMFEIDWGRAVLEGQTLPAYWRRQVARRATERVIGVDGTEVDTAPHLLAFRDWLVERAAKSGRRVINATGAGILSGPAVLQTGQGSGLAIGESAIGPVAPIAVSATSSKGALARAQALSAQLATLRDDQPPLSDWIASYSRSLDRAMLDTALAGPYVGPNLSSGDRDTVDDANAVRDGNAGTKVPAYVQPAYVQPATAQPADVRRSLIALPESLAILRAVRDGRMPPEWASESAAWTLLGPTSGGASPLESLLRLPSLGVADAGYPMPPASGDLHQFHDLDWPQPAAERMATLLVESATAVRAAVANGTHPVFFHQRLRAASPGSTATRSQRELDRQAQTFALATWALGRLAHVGRSFSPHVGRNFSSGSAEEPDASWRTALDLLDATSASLQDSVAGGSARLRITAAPSDVARRWRVAAPVPTDRLIECLKGTLLGAPNTRPCLRKVADGVCLEVGWTTNDIEADILQREFVAAAPYRVLTEAGLPKCLMATPAPDGTAIVTPRGQRASYRILSDGSFERMAEWPAPIVAEVHSGLGEFAWTPAVPGQLLFRARPGTATVAADFDFQIYTALWLDDRVLMTTSDGLWSWGAEEMPRRIAAVPPAVIVSVTRNIVSLDPLPLEGGRLVRRRMSVGWDLDMVSGSLIERSLPTFGQSWSSTERHRFTATTYPCADAIRLGTSDEDYWLLWPAPRAAVWVGPMLVVNTSDGQVVTFPDIGDTLNRRLHL